MDVDGHYESLDLQQMDDATYANIEPRREEEPQRMQSNIRRYKRVAVGVGLLCAVLALLNVVVPLYLHQSNMMERQQLLSRLEQLQIHANLTEQADMMTRRRRRRLCESHARFTFRDGLCYYISAEKRNWTESRQWCKDKQSDLMVIKNKEKQDFVERLNQRVWLGLTDIDGEGSFQWVDGARLTTPKYWGSNQPDNFANEEDCVEFYDGESWIGATQSRGWNDLPCSFPNNWICEKFVC